MKSASYEVHQYRHSVAGGACTLAVIAASWACSPTPDGMSDGVGGQIVEASGGATGSGGVSGSGGSIASSGGTGGGDTGTGSGGSGDDSGGGGGSSAIPGFSSDRADFGLGGESRCSAGAFAVCENFESTEVGALPSGWSLTGYGTRTVGTVSDVSARGGRSLQIDIPGGQGAVVAMIQRGDLGALGNQHFGRMFYRILGPGVSEFVHFDVFEGVGPWMDHQNAVRYASTGTAVGTGSSNWSWIYNVQPFGSGAGGEFGSEGDRSAHPVVDEWMCLEWAFDAAAQTATYYHDGEVIDYLVIDDERSEIPVFATVAVGLQKFQNSGAFRTWVDEVAFDSERIGCNF